MEHAKQKTKLKFLFVPDSFKGSLSAHRAVELLELTAQNIFPYCESLGVPMSDGGEGLLDCVLTALHGEKQQLEVVGPLGDRVKASYGIFDGGALIEMAEASGLTLIPNCPGNAMHTTSYGTGQLIKKALELGCRKITLAIGGSATNDGGMGAMSALGVRFLDQKGALVKPVGACLKDVERIDPSGLMPAVLNTSFEVICDVNNPLIGPQGATYVYGPQKGARPEELVLLDRGMTHYAEVIRRDLGVDIIQVPGAGAAGGMGAATMAFLGAKLRPGMETVAELIQLENLMTGVDLVVTGEGRVDAQSSYGKVLSGIGLCAKKKGIPVVAIVGGMGPGAEEIYHMGVDSIMTTVNRVMEWEDAVGEVESLFLNAAERMFRMIKIGMELS